MKKVLSNRTYLKTTAIIITVLIITTCVASLEFMITAGHKDESLPKPATDSHQSFSKEATSVLSQEGEWVTGDFSPEGTPTEVHVTISDTSGITIVADFHGFWVNNITVNSRNYYVLNMPGANSLQAYGKPELPCLFKYVQIPYNVDVEAIVLSSTESNVSEYITEYEIKPGPFPDFPGPITEGDEDDSIESVSELYFDPIYSNETLFPGIATSTEGDLNSTSLIMRGHRLVGLSFYPVQYSNATKEMILYSQLIVKLKYSFPAQIKNIPFNLRSRIFENCMNQTVLNCLPYEFTEYIPGFAEEPMHIPPYFLYTKGAEYLIITTEELEAQANRLADWKERKGLLSKVYTIPNYIRLMGDDEIRRYIKNYLKIAYITWYPAPTYVLLFGDVEHIPANYDVDLVGGSGTELFFQLGNSKIASDFGYFNIEGNGYFPEMIYSRISVDTALEAEVIVNKTLRYEQTPTRNTTFYENYLSAGYFQDTRPADQREDPTYPMIYTLEVIRHYLNDSLGYNAHINYSAAINERPPIWFNEELDGSDLVDDSIDRNYFPNFVWLEGYAWSKRWGLDYYYELERYNVTPNFNQGRFLVLYMGHGGSKNMYDKDNLLESYTETTGIPAEAHRDFAEGWDHPCLNTSYFGDLTNGDMTPLIINIACNTGWYDGETDEEVLYPWNYAGPDNPFAEYASECFAENITRLDEGGAIAVIASSRQAYIPISKHLMNGLIQAFWPGFLGSENQPIYEMGGALLFAKTYALDTYIRDLQNELVDVHPKEMMVQEYHLFGDPESQLWTDVPTGLIAQYPHTIGIGEQEFVVTVTANTTIQTNGSIPVPNAKVCFQKGSDVYQVGYTDNNGQVIFNVHPGHPGMVNLTVTAHNYIPHMGNMECICGAPILTLTPPEGPHGSSIRFSVNGFFEDEDVEIYYESLYVTTLLAGASRSYSEPTIRYGFVNVIAKGVDSNLIAVTVYRRYFQDPRPDPYIYSQWDESTWEMMGVSGDDIGWYNPDITIFQGIHQISEGQSLNPAISYIVRIWVHNQENVDAWNTKVTLRYAPIGGGVTWDYAGEDTIYRIYGGSQADAYVRWQPPRAGDWCLKVIIENTNDKNLDNNIGVLAVSAMEYSSPAITNFNIGNPTDNDEYVCICVKQLGNYSDVWNATIIDYSSQIIHSNLSETITLQVDPGEDYEENEWRLLVANVYVNYKLVGGISFNVSRMQISTTTTGIDPGTVALILGGIGIAIVVAVLIYKRKKSG